MAACAFLALIVLLAIFGPWIQPHDPNGQDLRNALATPNVEHWLGTDPFGRDNLSRLIAGCRVSVIAIAQTLAITVGFGLPLGLLAGGEGKWFDAIISRIANALLSIPPLVLALAVVALLGPGLRNVMLALGITLAPRLLWVTRSAAREASAEGYIEACRSLGLSRTRILWRHLLPAVSSPVLIQTSFYASTIILSEASLSYLGLGVQAPDASWGTMVRTAADRLGGEPWLLIAPSVMIMVMTLSFSVLGDALRDIIEGSSRDSV